MKISQKLHEDSNAGYFLEVNVQCSEKSYQLHNDLPFLTEKLKNL